MQILFIDEDKDSADEFVKIVNHLGHNVQVARDQRSALGLVHEQEFNYVLVDTAQPDTAGRELGGLIRKEEVSREAGVVAVTEISDLRRRNPDLFDGNLHKPVTVGP